MYSGMKMEKWELGNLFQEWRDRKKENDGGSAFNMICVNVTMYPQHNNNKKDFKNWKLMDAD
jgi:hypothetical protein